MLATPGAENAGAETLPGPRPVQGVVPAAIGLPRMLSAATARAARQDATDRARLHGWPVLCGAPRVTLECRRFDIESSVGRVNAAVYSPAVLHLRSQPYVATEPLVANRRTT